jgi:hypothetical protein
MVRRRLRHPFAGLDTIGARMEIGIGRLVDASGDPPEVRQINVCKRPIHIDACSSGNKFIGEYGARRFCRKRD